MEIQNYFILFKYIFKMTGYESQSINILDDKLDFAYFLHKWLQRLTIMFSFCLKGEKNVYEYFNNLTVISCMMPTSDSSLTPYFVSFVYTYNNFFECIKY